MKPGFHVRPVDVMVVLAIALYCGWKVMDRPPRTGDGPSAFAAQVDLAPFNRTAIQADGRLRSFESHIKTYMGRIIGPRTIDGQPNRFTYLDLIFRPEAYADADIIYVKNRLVREQVLSVLEGFPQVDETRLEAIRKTGLISRVLLNDPAVQTVLDHLGKDLIRTGRVVDAIHQAVFLCDARSLADNLRVVAPPDGDMEKQWLSISRLAGSQAGPVADLDGAFQDEVKQAWSTMRTAWRNEDAVEVNTQIAKLARLFPSISPQLYPPPGRLAMESWYFRNKSMTWVWLIYLAGVIPLLMSVIYKWDRARTVGMVVFALAFGLHTVSLLVRWYISGRWPNANMFEAVTTSAWFGGMGALILEWVTRRTSFRNLFALGSAVMSMAALMAAYFLPARLDSTISNKMAALNDVWLYIHTNVIIWSYAVIGLACIPALLLLRHRWCVHWDQGTIPKARLLVLPMAVALFNFTGYKLLMHTIDDVHYGLTGQTLAGVAGAFWCSLMLIVFEVSRRLQPKGISASRAPGKPAARGSKTPLPAAPPRS